MKQQQQRVNIKLIYCFNFVLLHFLIERGEKNENFLNISNK